MLSSQSQSERGAILIHVAVASVVLIAFTMFVVDYGLMWVSRHQAQNSADAGALAGAAALAFDSDDRSDTGPAKLAAQNFAFANDVMGQNPDVQISTDIYFYSDEPAAFPDAECDGDNCIRVDVYRNQARSNPLPMWFGQLVGLIEQGVRAVAIARVGYGDTAECLKPWAIPDRWAEGDGTAWSPDDTFDPNEGDYYIAPSGGSAGTGFTPDEFFDQPLVLKQGSPHDALAPSFFQRIDLPSLGCDGGGSNLYECNIANCTGVPAHIGDTFPINTQPGNAIGPTRHGVEGPTNTHPEGLGLIQQDPDARWSTEGGYVYRLPDTVTPVSSPRIVCVPVFDTGAYYASRMTGNLELTIVNIVGFFVDRMDGQDVVGWYTNCPGSDSGENTPGEWSFIRIVQLVR